MITATATIVRGNLIINRVADFHRQLDPLDGQEVDIIIKKRVKSRSNNQNKFYWGVFLPAVKYGLLDAGHFMSNEEQVHDLLKLKFLKYNSVNEDTGEFIEALGSTTTMSTFEFETYLTNIRAWAAEYLNCVLPFPNE